MWLKDFFGGLSGETIRLEVLAAEAKSKGSFSEVFVKNNGLYSPRNDLRIFLSRRRFLALSSKAISPILNT